MGGVLIGLTGNRYGKLLVIKRAPNFKGRVAWLCKCDCGNEKIATTQLLRRGSTTSCGCLFKEWAVQFGINKSNSGDNRAYHPLYNIYMKMLARCYDKFHVHYKNYGGRGITVCETWKNDFWKFVEDMGERPSLDHTLDREDNDGPYVKSNCRWVTWDIQGNNKRKRKPHIPNGVIPSVDVVTETT